MPKRKSAVCAATKLLGVRLEVNLLKQLKILSVKVDKPINLLVMEAVGDLLQKYEKESKKK